MAKQLVVDITAYAMGNVWIDHSVAPELVRNAMDGWYGFKPGWVLVNDAATPKALAKAIPNILKRLASNTIDDLTLSETEDDGGPAITLSISNDEDLECHVALTQPVAAGHENEPGAPALVDLALRLIKDSRAEYAYIHDSKDWVTLQNERDTTLLFIESCARGAHWVTYFCNSYVDRLGGRARLEGAPAWKVRVLDDGVLIYACPDPTDLDKEPKRSQIRKLHEFLEHLVRPEERP